MNGAVRQASRTAVTAKSSLACFVLLLLTSCTPIGDAAAAATAAVCDVSTDTCNSTFDLTCDANGITCSVGSDCFDCDPCMALANQNCSACIAAGCVWCTSPGTINPSVRIGICSAPTIAAAVPDVCIQHNNGTAYTSTCDNIANSTPTATATTTTSTTGNCSLTPLEDPCPFLYDGKCDADGVRCPLNSDCFDCDPCHAYRFEGCETCTAMGCLWCDLDVACFSVGSPVLLSELSCNFSDFVATCPATNSNNNNVFSDPFYDANSWIYDLINIKEVWKSGITGAGIGIRINDDGVDASHLEFSGRFDVASSCDVYTPTTLDFAHGHGTFCASMAAASGNSTCAVGIAPDATLSACRVVADVGSDSALALANSDFSFLYKNMTNMHVSSNSYGIPGCKTVLSPPNRRLQSSACPFNSTNQASPCSSNSACANVTWTSNPNPSTDCDKAIAYYCQFFFDDPACTSFLDFFATCEFNGQDPEQLKALMIGTTNGRKGKGIVYVFAAGNDFVDGSNVNFEGSLNSRFTIAVGAVDKHGMHASYSTGGAPLFVSAPGGDFDFYTNNIVALAGGGCTDATEGTSFATPIVSGIVALMLQINPELAWRDVQGVLASTSRQIQPNDPSWSTNAAGFHHSYLYGFGLIDASAAVKASETWQSYSAEIHIPAQSGSVDLTIADYPGNPVVSTVTVVANATFVTESAIVYLDLSHPSRGDLEISLTSPAGTVSILSPGRRPENSQVEERWKLMTVRNWGESASGQWTLQIADKRKGDVSSCVDLANWTIPSLTLDCSIVNQLGWCVNGTQSSLFSQKFPLLTISDPSLADGSGQTPADACCACGGGVSASTIKDLFRSWRLDVYGHDQTSGPQSMPTTSSPTSGSGSATAAPQAQSTAAPVRVRQAGSTTTAPRAQPPAAPLTSPLQPVATFPISTPRSGAAHTMFDRVQTSILLFLGMASIRFVF